MLYGVLCRMIERGALDGLSAKIDVLFAFGRLTQQEYEELVALLPKE